MSMSFAFYGRVSTEDQQDPEASRGWQLSRARALIEPMGGTITAEFFDIGMSRSVRWKDRPQAAALLASFADRSRGFDAVVIGEPQRAFYGEQFAMTFPVFTKHGIALWVPEVGGPIDPGSEAHDMVMSLYSGMGKAERQRIKVRVRTAMSAQAAEGRFLGGRPPYGYRLVDAGPHPNPSKAATGQRLRQLEPDPATAPIVQRIFSEYLNGAGLFRIAEGLTADGVPCPSAADPERNRHRCGIAWSKAAIRAILRNPRYTGRQVWNRQRRDEDGTQLDVDVVFGHKSVQRWNERGDWIWSTEPTHEAIIDPEVFARAQEVASAGRNRPAKLVQRRRNPYVLRGLMICATCGRRMQGSTNHGRAHYRCKMPSEYALANKVEHPPTVYVREDRVVPVVDAWIARAFDPANVEATLAAMAGATPSAADEARADAARRTIADCDARLAKYRATLDAGGDPTVVASWIAETTGKRLEAEAELVASRPAPPPGVAELRLLLDELGDVTAALAEADPDAKAKFYDDLGLRLVFDAERELVTASVYFSACRRGDPNSESTTTALVEELPLAS